MKNITSIAVTDAMITSSTFTEPGPGEAEWVSGAAYTKGVEVIRAAIHRKFTRLVTGTGTTAPELDTANWLDTGATNKMAMFDLTSNQQSVATGPQTIVLTLGKRFNAIGVTGLQASKVKFELKVGSTVYWSPEIKTSLRNTLNWTDYLLGAFRYLEALVRFDAPPITSATLTITLTGSTVKVGRWFIGTAVDMGKAELDADGDVLDLSKADRDAYGKAKLVPRAVVPRPSLSLVVDSNRVDKLRDLRKDTAGKVTLWCGLDDNIASDWFNLFLIAGKWNRFRIKPLNKLKARVSVELEEI